MIPYHLPTIPLTPIDLIREALAYTDSPEDWPDKRNAILAARRSRTEVPA